MQCNAIQFNSGVAKKSCSQRGTPGIPLGDPGPRVWRSGQCKSFPMFTLFWRHELWQKFCTFQFEVGIAVSFSFFLAPFATPRALDRKRPVWVKSSFWGAPNRWETGSARALCDSGHSKIAKCPGANGLLTFRAPQNELFKAERIFRLKAHSVEKGAPIIYFETAIPLSK